MGKSRDYTNKNIIDNFGEFLTERKMTTNINILWK